MSKLEDICYRMYENSGKSKYIRAEWADEPYHLDIAKTEIKVLILETFGDALIESKSVEEMGEKFRKKVLSL